MGQVNKLHPRIKREGNKQKVLCVVQKKMGIWLFRGAICIIFLFITQKRFNENYVKAISSAFSVECLLFSFHVCAFTANKKNKIGQNETNEIILKKNKHCIALQHKPFDVAA